jgi:hypothetical protein
MSTMILPSRTPKEARNAALRAETIGILIFVVIGFVIVLLRYGRFLDWHAR